MDPTVPRGAATLLDFIGDTEAPEGYGTIYANKQSKLPVPLTQMTVGDIVDTQKQWSRNYGSSAAGRYQFIRATLISLCKECSLSGTDRFTPDLQDRLGYHLLKRRGYAEFMAGGIDFVEFGKRLAMEWASLPVLSACRGAHRSLARGQSYYAGDALNRALVTPERVTAVIRQAYEAEHAPEPAREDRPAGDPVPSSPASVVHSRSPMAQGIAVAGMAVLAGVAAGWDHLTTWIGAMFQ